MFFILSFSCGFAIYWSQVLSQEWRCSWSSDNRQCSNYIWVMNNLHDTMFVICTCKKLDINFIHGYIHSWSYKNACHPSERNMGCIFVLLSLPCCTQYYITLNHITMELNMCNAISMAAHPPIKLVWSHMAFTVNSTQTIAHLLSIGLL